MTEPAPITTPTADATALGVAILEARKEYQEAMRGRDVRLAEETAARLAALALGAPCP
jgi:hypothetical protein